MSQTVQPMAAADAARQQLQQLKTDSSQQLAQLMLEQQHKLSQMVQQKKAAQQAVHWRWLVCCSCSRAILATWTCCCSGSTR
jgi:hypothetical protein